MNIRILLLTFFINWHINIFAHYICAAVQIPLLEQIYKVDKSFHKLELRLFNAYPFLNEIDKLDFVRYLYQKSNQEYLAPLTMIEDFIKRDKEKNITYFFEFTNAQIEQFKFKEFNELSNFSLLDGEYIYLWLIEKDKMVLRVVTREFELKNRKSNLLFHSSLLNMNQENVILAAGQIKVQNGEYLFDNGSGHFRPHESSLLKFIFQLSNNLNKKLYFKFIKYDEIFSIENDLIRLDHFN